MLHYIIFFIFFYIIFNYCKENFLGNIKILSKNELLDIILNNDKYYSTFNSSDLHVRNVENIDEYKKNIIKAPITINYYEEYLIRKCINKIINILENYDTIGFNGQRANKILWTIGIIDNNIYEDGLPHTINNIIIIPKSLIYSNNLKSTLIHELVHVYQKQYPEDVNQYLKYYNFKIIQKPNLNIRANPDTDNNIYIDNNNNMMLCVYNDNPKSIMDVTYYPTNNPSSEHPFELMAYTIENDMIHLNK
jgi:hypothetical protein